MKKLVSSHFFKQLIRQYLSIFLGGFVFNSIILASVSSVCLVPARHISRILTTDLIKTSQFLTPIDLMNPLQKAFSQDKGISCLTFIPFCNRGFCLFDTFATSLNPLKVFLSPISPNSITVGKNSTSGEKTEHKIPHPFHKSFFPCPNSSRTYPVFFSLPQCFFSKLTMKLYPCDKHHYSLDSVQ